MKFSKSYLAGLGLVFISLAGSVSANVFKRTGDISRILVDNVGYGGCMILLTTDISNGCPASGWVSLDCQNIYSDNGKLKYAAALTAMSLSRPVTVYIDNSRIVSGGYCAATRIDIR